MQIDNVHVRVEHTEDEGFIADEVFVTCSKPYINFALQLRDEFVGKIAGGIYSIEFKPYSFPEPVEIKEAINPEVVEPFSESKGKFNFPIDRNK